MDRPSPTSIRYSYSNSSLTDSVGISRTLERSGHNNSSGALSARFGVFDYANNGSSGQTGPILQHPSQSAQSSSIPSQQIYQLQSPTTPNRNGSQSARSRPGSNNVRQMVTTSITNQQRVTVNAPQQGTMTSASKFEYEMMIQQLKIRVHQLTQENQEKQALESKYQRSLVQLNQFQQINKQLRLELEHNRRGEESSIQISCNYMESSKNSELTKTKQEEIRRLKDSILVLQKEKNSYQDQTNQLMTDKNELEQRLETYENKLALVTQELQRVNRINKDRNTENARVAKENQQMRAQNAHLKLELQKSIAMKSEQSSRSNDYMKKMDELYQQIQKYSKVKIQMEANIRKLTSQLRIKDEDHATQIQRYKLEAVTQKRQYQQLQAANKRLKEQLKVIHQKNSTSQIQLSTVSTQTNKLQMIIKHLEDKLRSLEKDYLAEVEKMNIANHQNMELASNLKTVELQLKRMQSQSQKYQQQSTQLRRKLQEISMNSERQNVSLGQNIKQRQIAIKELNRIVKDNQNHIKDLQVKNKQYYDQLRASQQKNHQLTLQIQRLEATTVDFQNTVKNYEQQITELNKQLKQRDNKYRQLQQNYELSSRNIKEWQAKSINLSSELQKIQMTNSSMISQKSVEEAKLRQMFGQQIAQLQRQINTERQQKNDIHNKLQQSNRENQKLNQQSQTLRTLRLQLQNKVKVLQSTIQSQQQQFVFLQQSQSSLQKQLKAQISSNNQLTFKMSKDSEVQKSQYFDQINKKDLLVFELQQKMQEHVSIINASQLRVKQKDGIINEQAIQIQQYRQQSLQAKRDVETIKLDFNNLVEELQHLKQSNMNKQKIFNQAKEQLNVNLLDKQNKLNQKNEEAWRIQNELNSLAERYRHMERENQIFREGSGKMQIDLNNLVDNNKSLQRQLKQNQQWVQTKDKQSTDLKIICQKIEQNFHRQRNQLMDKNTRLEQRNRILQKQAAQANSALTDLRIVFEKQVQEHKVEIYKLEQRCRQAQFQIQSITGDFEIVESRTQQMTKHIEIHYKPMEQKYKQLQLQYRQLQSVKVQVQQQKRINQKLREQLKIRDLEKGQLNQLSKQMEQQCRSLQQQLMNSRSENKQLQGQIFTLQSQSHESIVEFQSKSTQAVHQAQQYKQNLNNLTIKYQNLELEYSAAKEQQNRIQLKYTQIETRYNILDSQLKMLQSNYTSLIETHRASQGEVASLREIAKKTEQERFMIQQQRDQLEEYFKAQINGKDTTNSQIKRQLANKEQAITQLRRSIQQKDKTINDLRNQLTNNENGTMQLRNELENSLLKIEQQQNVISQMENKLESFEESLFLKAQQSQNKIMILQSQLKIEQDRSNKLNTEVSLVHVQLRNMQQINQNLSIDLTNIQKRLQTKEDEVTQMGFKLADYANKIGELSSQIDMKTTQIARAGSAQVKQLQIMLEGKNNRIKQLEHELTDRDEQYKREISNLRIQAQRFTTERLTQQAQQHLNKVHNLQMQLVSVRSQLQHESTQYTSLVSKLQIILKTNDHNFEQILHNLQKLLQLNSQLILQISKSNVTVINTANNQAQLIQQHFQRGMREMGGFKNQAIMALHQIRQSVTRNAEQVRSKLEDIQDRRASRDRGQKRDKQQQGLARDQRIIRFMQEQKDKQRLDKQRQSIRYQQLYQKITQNSRNNAESIRQMSSQLAGAIRQQLSQLSNNNHSLLVAQQQRSQLNSRQTQQNIIRENKNSTKFVHEITNNILSKMQNMTSLFMENNQEYKISVAMLQDNIAKLQKNNQKLCKQIQHYRRNEQQIIQKYNQDRSIMQTRHRQQISRLTATQQRSAQKQPQLDNLRRQLTVLQTQLQRSRIENDQMRKQCDSLTLMNERTIANLTRELHIAKLDSGQYKQMQQYIMPNGMRNSRTGTQQLQKNNKQKAATIRQYEQKIVLLQMEIGRLHQTIDNYKDRISHLERQAQINNKQLSFNISARSDKTTQKQFETLHVIIEQKNKEIQQLRLQSIESAETLPGGRQPASHVQLMELKHKLALVQQENANLQAQIDRSVKTIKSQTDKIQTLKLQFTEMAGLAQHLENQTIEMQRKYNADLIRKSKYENERDEISEQALLKNQTENRDLRQQLHELQMKNQQMREQQSKLENLIQVLKSDNLDLRKTNYSYEVEFQKIGFMKQKIGKLNNQVDRISQINVQLNQQVSEARFAIGDQAVMERKLMQCYLSIVIMAAQIQALRIKAADQSRERSRDSKLNRERRTSQQVRNSKSKIQNISKDDNATRQLTRVKSQDAPFRYAYKYSQSVSKLQPDPVHRNSLNVSFDSKWRNDRNTQLDRSADFKYNSPAASYLNKTDNIQISQSVKHSGQITIPKPLGRVDPILSMMLRNGSNKDRHKSRSKSKSGHKSGTKFAVA